MKNILNKLKEFFNTFSNAMQEIRNIGFGPKS
jgi:hypothetical protein